MTKKWLMYVVAGLLCTGMIAFAVANSTTKDNMANLVRAKRTLATPSVANNGPVLAPSAKKAELNSQVVKENSITVTNLGSRGPESIEEAPVAIEIPNKDLIADALDRLNSGVQLNFSEKQMLNEYFAMITPAENEGRNPLDDQGGPTPFGYRWVDNLNGDTATYAWEEPTNPIVLANIADIDDGTELMPLGITFPFYGGNYTQAHVSSNGGISLAASFFNYWDSCPRWTDGSLLILPWNDDLNTTTGASSDGGRVVYQQYADHVTITWDSVGTCCTPGNDLLDFQAQLWNDGKIKFQYRQVQHITGFVGNGSSPMIGIQQSPTLEYLNYACISPADSAITNAYDGRAVWFYIGAGLTNDFAALSLVSPTGLVVSPNANINLIAQFINFGATTESSPVKYRFNMGAVVTEATAVLPQFGTENHDFAGTITAPGTIGDYELLVYSDLATDENRGNDTLRRTIQVRLCADQAITAPGTWTGTTTGAGDNCALRAGEDYVYEVTIPTAGLWTFTLCGGSTWDTYLYLTDACCGGNLLGINDDSQCDGVFTLQSTISCVNLAAGTYYVDIEPFSGSTGPYTLNINQIGCTPGRCCYFDGSQSQCTDNLLAVCNNLGGTWTEGVSCASDPCVVGACCYSTGICAEMTAEDCASLGGIYSGDGSLCSEIVCVNPCELECGPFDLFEVTEFDTCANDFVDPNGGCNNLGEQLWQQIQCGDTICGRTWTYLNCDGFNYRDTDWYEFTITETMDVSWSLIAEFDDVLGFIIGGPCETLTILGQAGGFGPCGQVYSTTVFCLPPGTYWTWASVNNFAGLPFSANLQYRAWLECTPCSQTIGQCCYNNFNECQDLIESNCINLGGVWDEFSTCEANPCVNPCILDCEPNDIVEADETGYCDNNGATDPNGGCNLATPAYTEISCNDTVCGETFTCELTGFRDTDWYRFTVDQPALVSVSVTAEFNNLLFGIVDISDCFNAFFIVNDFQLDCSAGWSTVSANLVPGTYVAFAAYGNFGGLPEGEFNSYRMAVNGICVNEPCDPVTDLAIVAETVGSLANNVKLYWTAPQDEDYKVWSTTNPNHDGDPDDGADPDWTLEATLLGLTAGPQTWTAPAGFVSYLNYNVTAVCSPTSDIPGRCCYGDNQCADGTEGECDNLGGTWTAFMTCATACPPPPPVNDDCGSAITVQNGVPLAGYTTGAVSGADITTCTFNDVYDVWYAYTSVSTAPITISTCEATYYYDTALSLWSACGGTELACNDDNCVSNGLQSTATYATPAQGTTYYVRVSGYSSQTGTFTLSVTQ